MSILTDWMNVDPINGEIIEAYETIESVLPNPTEGCVGINRRSIRQAVDQVMDGASFTQKQEKYYETFDAIADHYKSRNIVPYRVKYGPGKMDESFNTIYKSTLKEDAQKVKSLLTICKRLNDWSYQYYGNLNQDETDIHNKLHSFLNSVQQYYGEI